ncbi:MAG: flagellar motor switch protein FliN [Alphaproteobacteria bacterium]|nr:flagellar motor switch protein FliN [Alphaproteobacteria bacterium]
MSDDNEIPVDSDETLDLSDLPAEIGGDGENLLSEEEVMEPMRNGKDLEAVYDIPVQLSAVLGKSQMQVSQLLKLGRGAVVELDRKVGEAIDIYVNNRLVARGEVVVVEERLGVTMTEIIKSERLS